MRHKVVHGYLGIDDDIVWQVATEDLPELVASLEAREFNEHPVERGMTHAAIHSHGNPSRLAIVWRRNNSPGGKQVHTVEVGLIHINPARSTRPELHFGPPRFLSQVNVGRCAVCTAAALPIRPLRECDVEAAIILTLEPNRRKTFATIGVSENRVTSLEVSVR